MLGQGTFGQVREATDTLGNRVAVKEFSETHAGRHAVLRSALSELLVLQRAAHRRVVAVLDVFVDRECVRLVFEHAGTSLHHLVAQQAPLGAIGAQVVFRQCLEGLAWVHQRGIIHADLSSSLSCFRRAAGEGRGHRGRKGLGKTRSIGEGKGKGSPGGGELRHGQCAGHYPSGRRC